MLAAHVFFIALYHLWGTAYLQYTSLH